MILYHYSVDSFHEGNELVNDYKKQYHFAEPYILALQKGRSVFDAVFFSTMYLSREVCALNLRKYENYQKDAVEGIFEFVRSTEFGEDSVSRINCVYYCKSEREARDFLYDDCLADGLFTKEQVCLLEVEVDEKRVYYYDQQYFNMALDAIKENEIDRAFVYARKYYSKERTNSPLIEVLCDSPNVVLQKMKI